MVRAGERNDTTQNSAPIKPAVDIISHDSELIIFTAENKTTQPKTGRGRCCAHDDFCMWRLRSCPEGNCGEHEHGAVRAVSAVKMNTERSAQ